MAFQRRSLFEVRTDKVRPNPQGGISVDAVLSRVGVLRYEDPSGREQFEYRPADEVFSPESMASLRHAPVTVDHPSDQLVTTRNFRKLTVGHVGEDVRQDGDTLIGTVHIFDEDTINAIRRGALLEISPGYLTQTDESSGTAPEGRYDAVQRDIKYNHIALLAPGEGRQGPRVALRLDAAGNQVLISQAMDEQQLQAMLEQLLPQVMEAVQAALPELMANAQVDSEEEPKQDEMKPEDKLDAADEEEPKADGYEEPRKDELTAPAPAPAGAPAKLSVEFQERMDRKIEAIRLFEKATGRTADTRGDELVMLREAAKAKGLTLRKDASRDLLVGALEVACARVTPKLDRAEPSAKDAPTAPTHAERVAAFNARLSGAKR